MVTINMVTDKQVLLKKNKVLQLEEIASTAEKDSS